MKMILTGSTITGQEAAAAGLVAETFAPGRVLEHTLQFASRMAELSLMVSVLDAIV